jgi:hypothetical protein
MDKTILNLVAILITGTGVIGSLIAYEPPEVDATYFGFNPFAYKKSEIDKASRGAFACLALFGLAVQAYPFFIVGLPEQQHTTAFYLLFFSAGAVLMAGIGFGKRKLCLAWARRSWFPKLKNQMKEAYESSLFSVENDGWRPDQVQVKKQLNNQSETYRNANFESVDRRIATLQKLFDIPDVPGDRKAKIATLKGIFQ